MITSKQNQYVKLVNELHTKKGRAKHKRLVIEGKKFISDCYKLGVNFDILLYDENNESFANEFDVNKCMVSSNLLKSISTLVTPQGVIAVVEQPNAILKKPPSNFLVLDGLQDAGNVGTIIRTALATNFNYIYLIDCVDVFSDKVVNASMTAVFKVNLIKAHRDEFINAYREWNLSLLVADLNGENALHLEQNYDIIGLVIGNEGQGVSNEIKSLANKIITLPMDKNIESLNASVSAGILMYIMKYRMKGE